MSGPRVKCLTCGCIIQSTHRHDCVFCDCEMSKDGNGTQIYVDGGDDYFRMGFEANAEYEILQSDRGSGNETQDKD